MKLLDNLDFDHSFRKKKYISENKVIVVSNKTTIIEFIHGEIHCSSDGFKVKFFISTSMISIVNKGRQEVKLYHGLYLDITVDQVVDLIMNHDKITWKLLESRFNLKVISRDIKELEVHSIIKSEHGLSIFDSDRNTIMRIFQFKYSINIILVKDSGIMIKFINNEIHVTIEDHCSSEFYLRKEELTFNQINIEGENLIKLATSQDYSVENVVKLLQLK